MSGQTDPADLGAVARRLAALSPDQRRAVTRELAQRGIKLPAALQPSAPDLAQPKPSGHPTTFSIFFFSAQESATRGTGYRMLLEAADLADRSGFEAVWTPERHFHVFGGPYPAPAVLAAALAARTERLKVRAGSVVLPLHDPIRVAEEWAVVDNLSHGRAGVAFASGFHPMDFVFAPERFATRREKLGEQIELVHKLWRGEEVRTRTGTGEAAIRTFPRPVQPELPTWLTASGENDRSFEMAGRLGLNVLTALLNQNTDELARRITLYRRTLTEHGHDAAAHRVTVMIHTYVGDDTDEVRETVRAPFYQYLRTHLDLARSLAASMSQATDLSDYAEHEDELLEFGFERYVEHASLIGTPRQCQSMISRLETAGVDEIAALLDFGVADDLVLASLERLAKIRDERDLAGGRR
jgi:natural product biosynthesis luciferase-like monooxygenase protein